MPSNAQLLQRYQKHLCSCPTINLSLDISRMNFPDNFFQQMAPAMQKAFTAMDALEGGSIANPDENRMVGHYWLRDASRAPTADLRAAITSTLTRIKEFAAAIHTGKICPQNKAPFTNLLVIGIGGSALGPQFVADAITTSADKMKVYFFDNTDPDGFDRTLAQINSLAQTLTLVISKSGGTKETRNGMLAAQAAYAASGLDFARHAAAITGEDSELDKTAASQKMDRAIPHVGLGRRSHQRPLRGRASPRGPAGYRYRRPARRRPRHRPGHPHVRHRPKSRSPSRPHVAPRRPGKRSQGHGGPSL